MAPPGENRILHIVYNGGGILFWVCRDLHLGISEHRERENENSESLFTLVFPSGVTVEPPPFRTGPPFKGSGGGLGKGTSPRPTKMGKPEGHPPHARTWPLSILVTANGFGLGTRGPACHGSVSPKTGERSAWALSHGGPGLSLRMGKRQSILHAHCFCLSLMGSE